MNTKDIYVVEVFIPTEYTMTTEMGIVKLKLCRKVGEDYIDLQSGNSYVAHRNIGYTKVVRAVSLSEYYYKIGLRKRNNHDDKDAVYKLVRRTKQQGKM